MAYIRFLIFQKHLTGRPADDSILFYRSIEGVIKIARQQARLSMRQNGWLYLRIPLQVMRLYADGGTEPGVLLFRLRKVSFLRER